LLSPRLLQSRPAENTDAFSLTRTSSGEYINTNIIRANNTKPATNSSTRPYLHFVQIQSREKKKKREREEESGRDASRAITSPFHAGYRCADAEPRARSRYMRKGFINLHPATYSRMAGTWSRMRSITGRYADASRKRAGAAFTPACTPWLLGVATASIKVAQAWSPRIVMQARKCHRRGSVADRSDPAGNFRARERERKGRSLLPVRRVTVPSGCNIILRRDCQEFKVARYRPRG